jgi:hypothetical protein
MATDDREATSSEYVLGHSVEELHRLAFQAALIEPITRRLLADAGVETGMHVLDIGTGRGDVAMLVAENGAVVGVRSCSGRDRGLSLIFARTSGARVRLSLLEQALLYSF